MLPECGGNLKGCHLHPTSGILFQEILSYGNGMFRSVSRKLNQARAVVRRDRICNTVKGLLVRTSIDFKKESMLRGIPHHLKGQLGF
jgi:hypothetical protein